MLNRLDSPEDLPVTLQGGEPGLHPDFIWIIKNLKKNLNIDILTNLSFNIEEFVDKIDPLRLSRKSPYPSIRASYHPSYMDFDGLLKKAIRMQRAGFSIGIFAVLHPRFKRDISEAKKKCTLSGVDFRTKEFLGVYEGRLYGTYLYPGSVGALKKRSCLCKTTELIIGPQGKVYRCHHDLYKNLASIGNLSEPDFEIKDMFRKCSFFGDCNPCDIKIKTDRFQVYGHTSVEITDIK